MIDVCSNTCLCRTLTCSIITLCLSSLIYFPVFYTIYDPILSIDWDDSKCIVDQIQKYDILWYTDKSGENHYLSYSLYHTKVFINDRWYSGFGCGSSESRLITGTYAVGGYSYQYADCQQPERCGSMLLLPLWFCNDCKDCDQFQDEKGMDCIWSFRKASGVEALDDLPLGYELEYPTKNAPFVQIVMGDDVYYYKADYIAMQVILLGFLMLLPLICVLWSCGLLMIRYVKR